MLIYFLVTCYFVILIILIIALLINTRRYYQDVINEIRTLEMKINRIDDLTLKTILEKIDNEKKMIIKCGGFPSHF